MKGVSQKSTDSQIPNSQKNRPQNITHNIINQNCRKPMMSYVISTNIKYHHIIRRPQNGMETSFPCCFIDIDPLRNLQT